MIHFQSTVISQPEYHVCIIWQEHIRRWDSECELFLRRHRTCRGQRLCPLNRLSTITMHLCIW